jgi:hypothetical protein
MQLLVKNGLRHHVSWKNESYSHPVMKNYPILLLQTTGAAKAIEHFPSTMSEPDYQCQWTNGALDCHELSGRVWPLLPKSPLPPRV